MVGWTNALFSLFGSSGDSPGAHACFGRSCVSSNSKNEDGEDTASTVLASAEGTKFSEDYGIFARMATSYFKPRETIRKSAHLGAGLYLSFWSCGLVSLSFGGG